MTTSTLPRCYRPTRQAATAVAGSLALALLMVGCSTPRRSTEPSTGPTTSPGQSSTAPPPSGSPVTTTGSGIALGLFVRYATNGSNYSAIGDFDAQVGRTPAIIQGFFGWKTSSGAAIPFPIGFVRYIAGQGALPMITWQPGQASSTNQANGQVAGGFSAARLSQPSFSLNSLASGTQDSYVRQWAEAAKAYGHPVYVRLMHEMNDHNYPWALGVNGNTNPAQYVAAWRHIVGIFQSVGATNVQFVWCVGANPHNTPWQALYPGDAYVQWVAIDGYNRTTNGSKWQTISDIFSYPYQQIVSFSDRPVMIAETGSVEDPSNPQAKAQWITNGFLDEIPQQFPRVKAVLYFDSTGRGFSYPLTSSPQALAAWSQVAKSLEYQAVAPTQALSY